MKALTHQQIKEKLIANGVKNLHEFGYLNADKETIITDVVYAAFFNNMLKDNKGKSTVGYSVSGLMSQIVSQDGSIPVVICVPSMQQLPHCLQTYQEIPS